MVTTRVTIHRGDTSRQGGKGYTISVGRFGIASHHNTAELAMSGLPLPIVKPLVPSGILGPFIAGLGNASPNIELLMLPNNAVEESSPRPSTAVGSWGWHIRMVFTVPATLKIFSMF